jgi:hypothetical protein
MQNGWDFVDVIVVYATMFTNVLLKSHKFTITCLRDSLHHAAIRRYNVLSDLLIFLLVSYNLKKTEMGRVCSTYGERKDAVGFSGGN